MSRQEAEPSSRTRQRANTTSFVAAFQWRKRTEHSTIPQTSQSPIQPALSLDGLIRTLAPPSVPSLTHARALASILSTCSPLPRRDFLNPILISLCHADTPYSIQAVGFDVLSAYWENHEASSLGTAERLSYFSLFLGSTPPWAVELWEPRFKALRAITKYGVDILGIEKSLIKTLQWWIEGAFEGLLTPLSSTDRSELIERERSVEILVKFLNDLVTKPENISRITDETMANVLHFYASLVDRSILIPDLNKEHTAISPSISSNAGAPPSRQGSLGHRRNLSSLSSSSTHSVAPPLLVPPPNIYFKHPADLAINLYLCYLTTHVKTVPSIHLNSILPLLFRALAFCVSPLPRLSVTLQTRKKNTLEDKISETLNSLFLGPYATACMQVLRFYLFPPSPDNGDHQFSRKPMHITKSGGKCSSPKLSVVTAIMTSLGANRTFRVYVRRALSARIARAYISRDSPVGYPLAGTPSHMEFQTDLMERVWPNEDHTSAGIGNNGWDAGRLGRTLAESVGAWVEYHFDDGSIKSEAERWQLWEKERAGKDEILEEAAGVLKDILQELDLKDDENEAMDEEEAWVVGLTLLKLSGYLLPLKNPDGTPFIVPIGHPNDAPTPFLRTISSLLSRDHSRALSPLLSSILINVAEHLTDSDTARLPLLMMEQHDLSPTSPDWLDNWESLLGNETLVSHSRPQTRATIMDTLQLAYESVKDMKAYRRPLADLVWKFCGGLVGRPRDQSQDADVMWLTIGEEIVLRSDERNEEDDSADVEEISAFLDLLVLVGSAGASYEDDSTDAASVSTADTRSPSTNASGAPSGSVSPTISRVHPDHATVREKEKESSLPSVMSIITSLTTGGTASRSQSVQPQSQDEVKDEFDDPPPTRLSPIPRDVSAVAALAGVFSQLVFTPFSLKPKNLHLALRVYDMLIEVLANAKSTRARLTALQFLSRLRADRDHRVYYVSDCYDKNGLIASLGALINRVEAEMGPGLSRASEEMPHEGHDIRTTRARFPQEREGQQASRGRGAGVPSRSAPSRSRSRTTAIPPHTKPLETLWRIPEVYPFKVYSPDSPSEVLVSYDPLDPDHPLVLPISRYLEAIISILEKETSWEILSYVLCHLPVQLSTKHLFCGPESRAATSKMLSLLCNGILDEQLAASVDQWPLGLKMRDAHGLAYQTLSVLIGYKRCFDLQQQHLLVEAFQAGLNSSLPTIKCCLHALSLSAFELQPSMKKYLSRILEKLSQIMSNPNMAVHILGFLSIIGSLKLLHANFTESEFKMVFGVALQYLQHYNRLHASPTMSWALSQHVRILSYSIVYVWFLALKLPDRPRHIRYITRQLLLANEANEQVDAPTEVCFDWLARYTYASADPRPTRSIFSDIVMNASNPDSDVVEDGSEKTWFLGNSVVTVRALARAGWVEVMSRRASGFSRFVCRVENVPMVGPGDVDPDLLSVPAGLIMEGYPPHTATSPEGEELEVDQITQKRVDPLSNVAGDEGRESPRPDPITGYVWSTSAPSQRRKQVAIDPAFLILQLSPFPDGRTEPLVKRVTDNTAVSKFVNSLDRIPVIDTHKVGIMYVAPGQTSEIEILQNEHGSPAYTRFLEGLGRLINLRGQVDVYAGGLDADEDGEYAYAWWDDIGQILYHTATMMPTNPDDPQCNNKKRHIGNDYVRIVWNDSGGVYEFDTLKTQFQFVNIVIEPHSFGTIAAFSNNIHENEYFKVTIQSAPGMTEFAPIGHFKLISAENLPLLVRQLSLLADWFASVFSETQRDTLRVQTKTNWHNRLEAIRRFKNQQLHDDAPTDLADGVMSQETLRDFTTSF